MVDTTSLFLHVLAATGMVAGALIQVLAGARVRAAGSVGDLVTWAGATRLGGLIVAGSAVVSLLTGGHLAGAVWTDETASGFSYPFITLGAIGLVLLAPVGPMLGGARLRRLIADAEASGGTLEPGVVAAARSPRLWGPVHSLPGVAVGLVALMVYKPGWIVGALLLLASFATGWVLGAVVSSAPSRRTADTVRPGG